MNLPAFPLSSSKLVRTAAKREGLFAQAYAMLLQLHIWPVLRHWSGSYTAWSIAEKTRYFCATHNSKKWILKDFPPRESMWYKLTMLHYMATLPLLFIRADTMKKSRFVPIHLPLTKANFCLVSRLVFSNPYESAFSALLIHSSVTPFPFPTQVLTSKKDLKKYI